MMTAWLRTKIRIVTTCLLAAMTLSSASAAALETDPQDVTQGGYGAFGGALAFSLLGGALSAASVMIYAESARCAQKPGGCQKKASVGQHVLVGTLAVVGLAGVAVSGWGAQKFAEHGDWNPDTGWMLAGGYLGLPATLLLQNAIPQWEPEWSRDLVGVTLGVGGAVGTAFAFRALARERGHAWPEFGFGAGGMGLGLVIGQIVAKDSVWVPILGGLGAVVGASAAALAF